MPMQRGLGGDGGVGEWRNPENGAAAQGESPAQMLAADDGTFGLPTAGMVASQELQISHGPCGEGCGVDAVDFGRREPPREDGTEACPVSEVVGARAPAGKSRAHPRPRRFTAHPGDGEPPRQSEQERRVARRPSSTIALARTHQGSAGDADSVVRI